jgi:SOS-response transcriptional repressor LexA
MTEAEKYLYIQARTGLSKKEFAESLGLSKEQGCMIGRGKYRPSREALKKLAQVYNVDLNWFINNSDAVGSRGVLAEIELIEQKAAAGRGIDIDEYADRRLISVPKELIIPHSPATLAAVFVSGDSMIDEKINEGDVVIFKKTGAAGNGIYVLSIGNTLLVKRVELDQPNNTVILISANPAYPPRTLRGSELDRLKIEGKVIVNFHRF